MLSRLRPRLCSRAFRSRPSRRLLCGVEAGGWTSSTEFFTRLLYIHHVMCSRTPCTVMCITRAHCARFVSQQDNRMHLQTAVYNWVCSSEYTSCIAGRGYQWQTRQKVMERARNIEVVNYYIIIAITRITNLCYTNTCWTSCIVLASSNIARRTLAHGKCGRLLVDNVIVK